MTIETDKDTCGTPYKRQVRWPIALSRAQLKATQGEKQMYKRQKYLRAFP